MTTFRVFTATTGSFDGRPNNLLYDPLPSNSLFEPTEPNIKLVKWGDEFAEGEILGESGEGVDVLGEALAAVTILAVGARDLSMHLVDVPREENTGVDGLVVATVAAAVVGDGIEVGHLERAKDVVGILRNLGLEGGHAAEFLTNKDLAEQVDFARKNHRLGLEVLNIGPLREELRHEVDLAARLLGEALGSAGQDGRADKDRHVGEIFDKLGHQGEILGPVILRRNMKGDKDDIRRGQIVIHPLRRVADQHLHVGVVLLQPHL